MAMYTEYFGLTEAPFSIAPDPRYLFMSEQHREALAHLLFGIQSDGGFVLLTGEVGTGKTTICRCLLDQLPSDCIVAFIINPGLTVRELLSTICDELRISYPQGTKSIKKFVDLINAYLIDAHAKARRIVLIIDEAQNLSNGVLEQIRLLTNLETDKRKLLQIILIGQPELGEKLAQPELRQLSQRIVARYHLGNLTMEEVASYVSHRLLLAHSRVELFPPSTLRALFRHSGGIPRLVNLICDRALLGAYAQGKSGVDRTIVNRAAREVLGEAKGKTNARGVAAWYWAGGLILLLSAASAAAYYYGVSPRPPMALTQRFQKDAASTLAGLRKPVPAAKAEREDVPSLHAHEEETSAASASRKSPPEVGQQTRQESSEQNTGMADTTGRAQEQPLQNKDLEKLAWESVEQDNTQADIVAMQNQTVPNNTMAKLLDAARRHDSAAAYRALFRLWKAEFEPQKGDARSQAEAQGLQCFSSQGGPDDLKRWDRPVVLTFSDDQDKEIHVALTTLGEGTAAFTFDDETVLVSAGEVFERWTGEYTLLRRGLPKYSGDLRVGKKGETVGWLKSQLARLQGEPLEAGSSDVFDKSLEEKVIRFQQLNGLDPDGIVGWQTLARLMVEADNDAPVLMENKKGF